MRILAAALLLPFAGIAAQKLQPPSPLGAARAFRYAVQSRTVTAGETTTPIANPEGGSKTVETVHLVVQLKSLEPKLLPDGLRAPRFLATFEESQRDADSDALDLSAAETRDPFKVMAGRSVQFALSPGGQLEDVLGIEELFRDKAAAQPLLAWLPRLVAQTHLPGKTIGVGEKWKNEHDVAGMPLDDLTWRSESIYLRNEPCKLYAAPGGADGSPSAGQGDAASSDSDCAIVLTHVTTARRGSASSDATPDDYRRNGLRTFGKWTGSGEILDSISLSRGVLISSTETSTQDLDFTIKSAATGSAIRRQGHSETRSEITLLDTAAATPAP